MRAPRCRRCSDRQPPADVQPHPEQGLELGVGEVGLEVAGQLEVGLLKDVRGIEAGPEPRVHAELDHPPQPIAIGVEQLGEGPGRGLRKCLGIRSDSFNASSFAGVPIPSNLRVRPTETGTGENSPGDLAPNDPEV